MTPVTVRDLAADRLLVEVRTSGAVWRPADDPTAQLLVAVGRLRMVGEPRPYHCDRHGHPVLVVRFEVPAA